MNHKSGLALAVCVFAAGPVGFAAEEFPAELPPTIAIAQFENGMLTLTERQSRPVEEAVTVLVPVQRVVNGQDVTAFVSESRIRVRQVLAKASRELKTTGFVLFDVAGQKIPEVNLAIILKTPPVVLISADGLPLAPFYQPLFRSDTLVVVPTKPKAELKPSGIRPVPFQRPPGIRTKIQPAPKATLQPAEGR